MITTRISVDFALPNMGARVEAMQGDGATRTVAVSLRANGLRWEPPAGVDAALVYRQPDGHKGIYDKLADDSAAITVSGNVASVVLIPQMLTVPGDVQCQLIFNDSKLDRLTSFPFVLKVSRNETAGAAPVQDYIRLQWMEDKLDELLRKAADSGQFRGEPGEPGEQGPQGEPGVSTKVNGIAPDETGNVTLTATDVGALPSDGGDMTGAINMNGQSISGLNDPTEESQAARKGYVDTAKVEANAYTDASVRKAAPRNLLDNSDFRNPVNQRGQTSYNSAGYTIDRWAMIVDIGTINVVSDGLELDATGNAITFTQRLDDSLWKKMVRSGKTYTLAIDYTVLASGSDNLIMFEHLKDNTVSNGRTMDKSLGRHTFISQFTPNTADGESCYSPFHLFCRLGNKIVLHTAALYEGSYTAETLPEYQPKGYAAELAECQRYFVRLGIGDYTAIGIGHANRSNQVVATIALTQVMRLTNPSITCVGTITFRTDEKYHHASAVLLNSGGVGTISLWIDFPDTVVLTPGYAGDVFAEPGSYLDVIAEL